MNRSRTAQYVAVMRTVLHRHGLLDDPYAHAMLTRPMRAMAGTVRFLPIRRSPFAAGLATRIVFFDRQVTDAIDGGITQIVVLGAGYDSRAWRFAHEGVSFYEVDHPATQADKMARAPTGGPRYAAVDLSCGAVMPALAAAGYDTGRPGLFILEGVTMYLDRGTVHRVLAQLASRAAPASRLAGNFAPPLTSWGLVSQARQRALGLLAAATGERHRLLLHLDDAQEFVGATGWQRAQAVSLAEHASKVWPRQAMRTDGLNPNAAAVTATVDPI